MSVEYEKRRVLVKKIKKEKYMDQIQGCLFDGAAGDALRYPDTKGREMEEEQHEGI